MSDVQTEATQTAQEQPPVPAPPPAPEAPVAPGPSRAALVAIEGNGVMLKNLEDLIGFAAQVVRGGCAPGWAYGGMRPEETGSFERARGAVAIAIQAGMEHGLGVLGGLQAFMVLDGNLSWKSEYAAGKIRNSPACKPGSLKFWCEGTGEARKGVAVAWRAGDPELTRVEFTFAHARQANLLDKKNWRTYPERMYQWRALSWLAKDKFSDVLGGIPLSTDVEDYDDMPRTRAIPATATRPELAAPTKPDPLMEALSSKVQPEPVPVSSSPAEEPGAAAAAKLFDEPETVTPPGCRHLGVPPSRLASAPKTKSIVCVDCGEEFHGEKETAKPQAQ